MKSPGLVTPSILVGSADQGVVGVTWGAFSRVAVAWKDSGKIRGFEHLGD